MNDDPFNDPALQSLAARLAVVPPRLPAREREQLLFQCGMAAGQSAAERAGAQSARQWIAATSLLAVLSIVLGYRVMTLTTPAHSRLGQPVAQVRRATPPPLRSADKDDGDSLQLSVTSALEHVVDFNWPVQTISAETSSPDSASDAQEPVLTPLSRMLPNSPWN